MYITNISSIPEDRVFRCSGVMANYLMATFKIPMLGKDGDKYYFAKTERLEACLKLIPFWYKLF